MNYGAVSFEWGTILVQLVMLLFYVFLIYFFVSILRFMKHKTRNDEEINLKLGKLLKLLEKDTNQNS